MRNEFVKLGLSNKVFQVEEEVEAFLVGNARESVIGILALQVGDQFGELVVVAEVIHGVGEGLPADNGREVAVCLAVTVKVSFSLISPVS